MIRIVENNLEEYISLCKNNPFGCRILSLYKTYSPKLPFVDYWVQKTEDNVPVCLISRLETAFILCITNGCDIEELSSFLRVSGATSIICDGNYNLNLNYNSKDGFILTKEEVFSLEYKNTSVITPTPKEVYSVIKKCASENFNVPDYDSFALDVGHKLNKKAIRILGIKEKETLCSCIMTLAEDEDSAVLGALATLPESRNSGYGTYLVKYLTNILINENKIVYLHRAKNENIEFYNNLGFIIKGKWKEYSLKDD